MAESSASGRERLALLEELNRRFEASVPFNRALGLELGDVGDGFAEMRLPFHPKLVGNPETGVLHGGAITAFMDACCGGAVFMKLEEETGIATLDLRIDYMKPSSPYRDVLARADCYRATRNVAFVRAVAFHDDPADPIATAAGAFMIGTKTSTGDRRRGRP